MEKLKQILSKLTEALEKAVKWFLGLSRKQQIIYASIAVVALAGTITICCIHRHKYTATVVEPTCTEQGYTLFVCSCGESYKDIYTKAKGHNLSPWTTSEPTCVRQGGKIRACECGYYESEAIEKLDHVESEWIVEREPTCAEEGSHYKKCLNCDQVTIKEAIPCLEHDFRSWSVLERGETCEENIYTSTCRDCKFVGTRTGTYEDHNWNSVYSFDDNAHWQKCLSCKVKVNAKADHTTDENGICTVCYLPTTPTEGIKYKISEDGTYAIVIGYSGTATKVRIASEYNGVPVKVISNSAFMNEKKITHIVISQNVTTIEEGYQYFATTGMYTYGAFYGCSNLVSIILSNDINYIGDYTFCNCESLLNVEIPNNVTSIGDRAFYGCSSLESVTIPDSVTSIGSSAFSRCSSLVSVVIPDSVTSIGNNAFYFCDSLVSVVIPDSVTSIDRYAFAYCDRLTDVYYTGTEEDWAEISIGYENGYLENATIHYNYVPKKQ